MSSPSPNYVDEHHGFGTTVIHEGQEPDAYTGAVAVPITLASTFAQASPGVVAGRKQDNSFGKGWEYSRTGNPTRGALERALAACEKGRYAVCYSSGMAATTAVMHLLKHGDHVLCIDDVYGDMGDLNEVEKLVRVGKTKLIWIETPTNPTLKITDIQAVAKFAKSHNLLLVVDNTFMSPYFQNPLTLGADIVMHSITKYINGHSDVVGGVVITNSEDINTKLRFIQNGIGAVPSPFDCYMALRGLKTLHLRMATHAKNAQAVAEYLEKHPAVEKVCYPGLKSHPQHEIAKKQASGFSGMVTFYIRGGIEKARSFLENLQVFTLAESLGAVESLAESPAIMTHASVPEEVRKEIGISDSLIRLSVGIEGLPDIIADLDRALSC
ncbi:cystathionine gamma-lyase [Plasmopara halstedii]|uniref:cystathionine gamma-lyase n=1 Tax=Plasmopara halstedii TaxID=4781 RepID=A0A0P1ABN2_PLAHL|nr:cystathionine gamma-lyase [Plasmopara halstedii]CEG38197.1 cystathionine gamma-lyase [Plasmopara halstedii]|eukprot:XP_024574566.1 cystathionine gamma-lyase [Plasmopara halstedii]